ncbi:MAG: hypothetical protein AB7D37_03800 [Desulfovibrio sp.]
MNTTPKFDTMSAVKAIETTSFDAAENRAAREYLRAQMDETTRAKFDEAVATLRESLDSLSPTERATHRGFVCEVAPGKRPRFTVASIPPAEAVHFTDTVPPTWSVEFCKRDLEDVRQFRLRFMGATEDQCPPLTDEKLTGQALEIARAFPDEHHARANLWRHALASLSPEQEGRLVFPAVGEGHSPSMAASV